MTGRDAAVVFAAFSAYIGFLALAVTAALWGGGFVLQGSVGDRMMELAMYTRWGMLGIPLGVVAFLGAIWSD